MEYSGGSYRFYYGTEKAGMVRICKQGRRGSSGYEIDIEVPIVKLLHFADHFAAQKARILLRSPTYVANKIDIQLSFEWGESP